MSTDRGETWRIGVDVGGTFTDLVLATSSGKIEVFKVPTVSSDPSQGAMAAVELAASAREISVEEMLERCTLFVHGSTVATNIVLEGKGAKVGLLATDGFQDALEIRRGFRRNPWDHRTPFPPVLVPRYLRLPIRGRIDRHGMETEAVSTDGVRDALVVLEQEGVESLAVSFFNSYLNPAHEEVAGEIIAANRPDLPFTLSSNVAPIMGEFERTSTAVLNAYISPKTLSYLRALGQRLAERGLRTPLIIIQSNGGAVSLDELENRCVNLLLSGPAGGVGALNYYKNTIGSNSLISIEIGGTSCDVILMDRGEFATVDMLDISGYSCVTPSIDVHTIGAGGGTIAELDAGGLLQVGPAGAGALPGPACYGLGGTAPTITDAQVVLGRLRPGPYANGAVKISRDLAQKAIRERIAEPLGIAVEHAAAGMIELMEQKLIHAVHRVSTERGHDPSEFTLVAAGGAGPLHAAAVGRAMNCQKIFVPKFSGTFCALGMLNVNVQHDYIRVLLGDLAEIDGCTLEHRFKAIEAEARLLLAREGFSEDRTAFERALDLRYVGQQWDVTVPVEESFDADSIRRSFEARYETLFGHTQPEGRVSITKIRLTGKGLIDTLPNVEGMSARTSAEPIDRRLVWADHQTGWHETPVYDGTTLTAGQRIEGPAVIEEQTTTIFIGLMDSIVVDPGGNYSIEIRK